MLWIHMSSEGERQSEDDLCCAKPLDVISEHHLKSCDLVYWAGLLRIVHKLRLAEVIGRTETGFVGY